MSRKINKFFTGIITTSVLLTTIFSPAASAASASFSTEPKVKNALYALAAYQCVNNGYLQDTAIGNKKDSILSQIEYQKVYIGSWLGDEDGNITCKTALEKTFGSGNITESMLNSGKLFDGVYEKGVTGEQKIKCNYGIINSSATATLEGVFSWPQGFYIDANGDLQNQRNHGVIEVVFNEDGPIRLEGDLTGIDASHTLESMKGYTIKWAQPEKICSPLVKYTEVYPSQGVNLYDEVMTFYSPIEATTDDKPFNEGFDLWDGTNENDAWLHNTGNENNKFTYTLTAVTSSSKLVLMDDAKTQLLNNIATIYLGGATNATAFLENNPDAKYILYGRYLFNGDGNASFACNGISVAVEDPNFSELSSVNDYWDSSQPYVASVNAYAKGSASTKTSYRTKFGGNGISDPGTVTSISFPGVSGNCKTLAGEFNNINPSSSTAKLVVSNYMKVNTVEELPDNNTNLVPDGGTTGATSDMAECFNNASSLGWILCPVLKFVGVAADGIWQEIADNWLVTDYEQYQASSSNGIYIAWGSIRNIANIVFAIMLFVVIMSQLTGIGISNYGIKKILPTLVMIIILVNISFLICQLLIDVSNVAGSSIEGITDFIRSKIPSSSGVGAGDVFRGSLASLFEAAGIFGIGYGAYLTVSMEGAAALIPLLIAILGILISVIFAFIILAIRQAGILLCVIISPLAIICYALPNTKSLFDKWKKLFTSLLFIYPVCAACIYGGQVMSSLMLASGNTAFMYNLVAMLLQIVPIFFIPSLIKGSLALAGNIGAKVSQFGSGLRNRATGSLRRSEMVNRARTEAQGRAAQRNQALFNKMIGRKGIAGAIGKYGSRRLARQTQAYQKMQLEDEHAKNLLRGDPGKNLSSALLAQRRADEQKDVDSAMDALVYGNDLDTTDVGKIGDALEDAMTQYEQNPDDYQSMVRARALVQLLMSKGDTGQSQALRRIRGHIDPTGNGGVTASAAMRSLGEYITNNDKWIGAIKAGDTGGFNFMNDLAMGNSIKAANTYNTMGTNKVTAGTIGGMGDSWYDGIDKALADGAMDETTVSKFADMATKALTDPRTAHMIKGERVATLNRLREQAYNNDVQKWLSTNTGKTRADYEAQFGKFQKIENPGDELKITHRKINMPNGWRQATADDISRSNPGLNLTQGEWINDNGGAISRLNTEQILQAQEIQRRNANIDVDNMQ